MCVLWWQDACPAPCAQRGSARSGRSDYYGSRGLWWRPFGGRSSVHPPLDRGNTVSTPQAPKRGTRRVGTHASQSSYRQQHRAVGRQLGQWQDTVRAVDYYTPSEVAQASYIARQIEVNARAQQTY